MGLVCSNSNNPCCSLNDQGKDNANVKNIGLPKGITSNQNEESKRIYMEYKMQFE